MTETASDPDTPTPSEPTPRLAPAVRHRQAWWQRYLASDEHQRIMADLALTDPPGWTFRFVVMLSLSVTVAAMGLSEDSAAVVIGAMLLAPLMVPVLGLAAALAMALPERIAMSLLRVSFATAGCIALAFLISAVLPDGALPKEVLARTSPDVRDLVVALAAGTAGAYATVRKDASAALPGVAVAVALVPPLATVGITLEAARPDLARGAMLLYSTNLAAIVAAGVVVFVATGVVPRRRLVDATPGFLTGAAVVGTVFIAVAIPLVETSVASAQTAQRNQAVNEIVAEWAEGYELSIDAVIVTEGRVSVRTAGPERPPDQQTLDAAIDALLGADTLVSVQWTQTRPATTTTILPAATTILSDHEVRVRTLTDLTSVWLESLDHQGAYELHSLTVEGNELKVDVVGTGEPPAVEDLAHLLEEKLGETLAVTLTWVPRSVLVPGATHPSTNENRETEVLATLTEFVTLHSLHLHAFEMDGGDGSPILVTVDLAGPEAPDVDELSRTIEAVLVEDGVAPPVVDIYFTERRRLGPGSGPPASSSATSEPRTTPTTTG